MPVDLPPELLDLIADHLEEDPASLGACCLACKALKDAAQPVLWRNTRLVDPSGERATTFARLAAGGPGRYTRSLTALAVRDQGHFPPDDVLAGLPLLEKLDLSCATSEMSEVDVSRFAKLDSLRHLRLSYLIADTPSPSSSFTFRNLSTLSLLGVDSPRRVVEELLRPSVVPALRVLALGNLEEEEQTYLPTLPTELLDQLDMLEVLLTHLNLLPTGILDHSTPTLVRLNTFHLQSRLPILEAVRPLHLIIDPRVETRLVLQSHSSDASRRALAERFYDPLRTAVNAPSSRLSTLWLPTTLNPSHASSGLVPPTLPLLLDECQQRGVDVRWVGEVKKEDGFHRPFWRYAREEKGERQQQEQRVA